MITRKQSLPFEGPYHLFATLRQLQKGRFDPTTRLEKNHFIRAMRTPEGPATLSAMFYKERACFEVETFGAGADWAMQHAASTLGIDRPAFVFNEEMKRSPDWKKLRDVYKKFYGMRFPKTFRVTQLLVPMVLTQLVTEEESKRAFNLLIREKSEPAPGPFQPLMLPVAKEALKNLAPGEFLPLGIVRDLGNTLRQVGEKSHALERAAQMNLEDAYAALTSIKGIGPWTAYCVMYKGMGFQDVFAYGDYHIKNYVGYFLHRKDRSTDDEMVKYLAPFSPYRGVAARLIEMAGLKAPQFGPKKAVRPIW